MTDNTSTQWIALTKTADIAEGEVEAFEVGDYNIALYHLSDGDLFATDNICTHALAYLSDGFLEGSTIECPLHGGCFDVKTGKGLCAPVTDALATYRVRITDDETVEVALPI
ncbi:non-heme iron oxygenase ferredoxin subunit (plasmid) [Sulfitobacter sp. OXR-159]|uniref:non-heme iron oxygenase ferredoxin subunit n=1 Tax=Sulfitobacter sp. OXR-159 TaxID=3100174 RepID=UPI002AC8F9CA|nr:non-heme iron oxygenase ferredoxin subunit [Sulfitobacter sp. OXR-159]WPZ32100.1 non-heme iron oxygenase ferredoxin subunit [Sulfitobacter sp. OXR-159]